MFAQIFSSLDTLKFSLSGFSQIFKANPYRDQDGRFTSPDKDVASADVQAAIKAYTAKDGPLASKNTATDDQRQELASWLKEGVTGKDISLYQGDAYSEKEWDQIWESMTTEGSVISLRSPSFSEDAVRTAGYKGGEVPVRIEVVGGLVGRDIQKYSVYPEEKEHLAAPDNKYKVLSAEYKTAGGKWLIKVECVPAVKKFAINCRDIEFSTIFKANPYHDELGRFSSRDAARFVSIGGVFDRQRASQKAKPESGYVMSEALSSHVDLSVPYSRIDKLNKRIDEWNDQTIPSWDTSRERLPHLQKPDNSPIGGLTDSDVRSAFGKDQVSVYMAMSPATLKKIIAGDEIKNSLQTGKGTFKTIGEERAVKEKEFLGVKGDPTTNPESFPKYGFVAKKGGMDYDNIVAFGYGDTYVEFHDTVRERTTVTIGDSYNNNSVPVAVKIPAPIDNMGVAQLKYSNKDRDGLVAKAAQKFKDSKDFYDLIEVSEYAEAQMYGKLDASHIKAIHVENSATAKALQDAIRKNGLDIKVVPSKTHTRLKKLSQGLIEAWEKIDSSDVENLGDSYIHKGFSTVGSNMWSPNWRARLNTTFNLPITRKAVKDYPDPKTMPVELKRKVIMEYIAEADKGLAGTLPKVLHRKSTGKGFTKTVFNIVLLTEYKG